MNIKLLLPILSISILFIACKDEGLHSNEPVGEIENFSQLAVGNYWAYDWYRLISTGGEVLMMSDTLRIVDDTIIGGRTYFIQKGTFLGNPQKRYLFDSANVLYTYPAKAILFTTDPTQTRMQVFGPSQNPLAEGYFALNPVQENITVPAGTFICYNFRGTIAPADTNYPHGLRFNNRYYSEGIGLVSYLTQYYSSPDDLEMRLVDYGPR